MYIYIYIHGLCGSIAMFVREDVRVYICMYMELLIHVHIYIHLYAYIHTWCWAPTDLVARYESRQQVAT